MKLTGLCVHLKQDIQRRSEQSWTSCPQQGQNGCQGLVLQEQATPLILSYDAVQNVEGLRQDVRYR